MRLSNIITQAQVISGVNSFEGNTLDVNQMATSLAIFHQTLNSINNDPKIILMQSSWEYQRDIEGEPIPEQQSSPQNRWVNISQLNDDAPEPVEDDACLLFSKGSTPFAIARTYPLPRDCRRVLKVISGNTELRKTDYAEIEKHRRQIGTSYIYAVNDRKIELVEPMMASVVYVKEYPEFMPQDEVTLPQESLDYVINLLAYNLALSFNSPRVAMCQTLAEKSYNALLGNLRVNEGEKYQSVYTALNRFRR